MTRGISWKGRALFLSSLETSGVDVSYRKRDRALFIGGWYDHMVGIPTVQIGLAEFLRGLGVTDADCRRALKEPTP